MNLRSFLFLMCILLVALILSNMLAGGIKLEGFEEGAATLADTCKMSGILPKELNDLKKTVDEQKSAVWKKNSNDINYDVLKKFEKYKGNCDSYIKDIAKAYKPAATKTATTTKAAAATKTATTTNTKRK